MRTTQDRSDVRTHLAEDVPRATIDQAVGSLMVAYGLDADQAFEMLRWRSQASNVKVRDLAVRLTEAASRGAVTTAATRTAFDALLHDVSQQPIRE